MIRLAVEIPDAQRLDGQIRCPAAPSTRRCRPGRSATAGRAVDGEDIAAAIPVEVPEGDLVQPLRGLPEIPPGHLAAAGVPPGDPGRQQEIVEAVAIEVAHAILAVGVRLDDIAGANRDALVRKEIERIVHQRIFQGGMREDVLGDHDPAARLVRQAAGAAPQLNRGVAVILKGIAREGKPGTRVAAVVVAKPTVVGPVGVELVRVEGDPGNASVIAAALEHEIARGFVASRIGKHSRRWRGG